MPCPWDPDFTGRSPMFEPLATVARELRTRYWPGSDDLNRIMASHHHPIVNASGIPLRFVGQELRRGAFEDRYEPRIFLRGEVEFRPCNWHDLLNALVWLTFPAAKAALNRRHYRELERQQVDRTLNRGPVQDALTLFDEGGVIIASRDIKLSALLTGYEWKELFWRGRAEVMRSMRFYLFGHALYEKTLEPFPGVTGRAAIFEVNDNFFNVPFNEQLMELDSRLGVRLANPKRFLTTTELTPLPVLGIPGWCEDNTQEKYYDNAGYFRPAPNEVTVRR